MKKKKKIHAVKDDRPTVKYRVRDANSPAMYLQCFHSCHMINFVIYG